MSGGNGLPSNRRCRPIRILYLHHDDIICMLPVRPKT